MSRIDQFSNVGIESISWSSLQEPHAGLPEKSLKPLGAARPTYIERVFKTKGMDAQVEESLSYRVVNEHVLTPANYQDILGQLRHLAATTECAGQQREIFNRAFQLLDELAGNLHQLSLNRWAESAS
ncbi:MAG: hypothetical protein OXE42_14520 [Gammaproteobacteria bacterium]|nr:hypothetical protein [Gammaproteobacteria bacterium]